MSVYFLPALIGLLLKLFILVTAMRSDRVSAVFLSLIIVFACHNAIESMGYILFSNGHEIDVFFRPYYVASIFMVTYVLLHGLTFSGLDNKYRTWLLLTTATGLSGLSLFTDTIVAGQYLTAYSVTAVEGPYYWVFAAYVPIVLLSNAAVLIYGYKSASTQLASIRCAYSLFALAPLIVIFSVAIYLKVTGSGVNATGVVPIATTLFLIIILKSESQHKLSDVRRFLPFSLERKTSSGFMKLMDEYVSSDNKANSYKDLQRNIEKEITLYTLNKCDNNISKATAMMGLKNRSTLYAMMSRLDIDVRALRSEQKANQSQVSNA